MPAPALQQWVLVFCGRIAVQQGNWRNVRKALKSLAVLAPDSPQVPALLLFCARGKHCSSKPLEGTVTRAVVLEASQALLHWLLASTQLARCSYNPGWEARSKLPDLQQRRGTQHQQHLALPSVHCTTPSGVALNDRLVTDLARWSTEAAGKAPASPHQSAAAGGCVESPAGL